MANTRTSSLVILCFLSPLHPAFRQINQLTLSTIISYYFNLNPLSKVWALSPKYLPSIRFSLDVWYQSWCASALTINGVTQRRNIYTILFVLGGFIHILFVWIKSNFRLKMFSPRFEPSQDGGHNNLHNILHRWRLLNMLFTTIIADTASWLCRRLCWLVVFR